MNEEAKSFDFNGCLQFIGMLVLFLPLAFWAMQKCVYDERMGAYATPELKLSDAIAECCSELLARTGAHTLIITSVSSLIYYDELDQSIVRALRDKEPDIEFELSRSYTRKLPRLFITIETKRTQNKGEFDPSILIKGEFDHSISFAETLAALKRVLQVIADRVDKMNAVEASWN